jgi:hypothetical protein
VVEVPAGPVAARWDFEPAELPTANELTVLGSREAGRWHLNGRRKRQPGGIRRLRRPELCRSGRRSGAARRHHDHRRRPLLRDERRLPDRHRERTRVLGQVPRAELTSGSLTDGRGRRVTNPRPRRRRPGDPADAVARIGVYASASRQKDLIRDDDADRGTGTFTQVSRLGNPLFNEVIVPMALKDRWNAVEPADDKTFADFVRRPELAALLPVLYPGVFPNLAALDADRADLVAVLLTGIRPG